jgi:hypothetical protein
MTPEQKAALERAQARVDAIKSAERRLELQDMRKGQEVIATTPDGGRVYMNHATGERSFASPGYSTTDPDAIDRIMEGATPLDEVQRGRDMQVIDAAPGGLVGGLVAKAGQGALGVGEWIDEGVDFVAPGAGKALNTLQDAMDRQYPKSALSAELAGGIVTSAPVAVKGVEKALQAPTLMGKVVKGAAMGGLAGGVEGALAGAGRNDEDREEGAIRGAIFGGGAGLIIGAGAPLLGSLAASAARSIKKVDVKAIANEFGISVPAARIVKGHLANDDLRAASQKLADLGDDVMLADAGPATSQLLDTAMAGGGEALAVGSKRVVDRANDANKKLTATLDRILGPAEGAKAAQSAVSQRTAKAREVAYGKAWASPIDYSTGARGEAVLQALKRVPGEYLDKAIKTANRRAQMSGDEFKAIMASIGDDGKVVFQEMPTVRQLHEIKVGLDDIVRNGTDPITGKMNPDAVDASKVAKMFRQALKDASPAYARATKLGGDKIAEENALNLGKRLLSKTTTFEDALDIMSGASKEARLAAKRGLRQNLEDTLSNVRRTITDPNTDAREAMQMVKDLSSRANEKKARLILGTDSKAFFDEIEKATAALELRAAVARNSATAIRQSGQDAVKAEVAPGALRDFAGNMGSPLDAARGVTKVLAGIDPANMSAKEKALMSEIANVLTATKGDKARSALALVERAMAGQPLKDTQANFIGRLVGGTLATGAYQSLTQPQ